MSVSYNQAALNKERKDKFIMVIPTPKFLKDDVNKFVRDNKQVNPDSVQFSIYGSVVPPVQIPNVENWTESGFTCLLSLTNLFTSSLRNLGVGITMMNLSFLSLFKAAWLYDTLI